jgi:hypothetical protein
MNRICLGTKLNEAFKVAQPLPSVAEVLSTFSDIQASQRIPTLGTLRPKPVVCLIAALDEHASGHRKSIGQ